MDVEPAHEQEPVAFRIAEWGGIISDAYPEPGDNQPEARAFCFAQRCFLTKRAFV